MSVSDRLIANELAKYEAVIERCIKTNIEAGIAMKAIHDNKLYKGQYETFEAYVKNRWDYSRARAYQLIEAAEVDANLSTAVDTTDRPRHERHLREIAKAPVEQQAEVVKKVAEKAAEENRKPTSKDYKKAVELLLEGEGAGEGTGVQETPPPPPPPPEPEHHPKEMAGPLMGHVKTLTQILNDLKKRTVQRGGEWIDVQAISTQISALKYSLKSAIYYADCPACSGKGCAKCKETGFLPGLKSAVVDGEK